MFGSNGNNGCTESKLQNVVASMHWYILHTYAASSEQNILQLRTGSASSISIDCILRKVCSNSYNGDVALHTTYCTVSQHWNGLQHAELCRVAITHPILDTNEGLQLPCSCQCRVDHLAACCCSRSCFKTLMENVIVWKFSGHTFQISARPTDTYHINQ